MGDTGGGSDQPGYEPLNKAEERSLVNAEGDREVSGLSAAASGAGASGKDAMKHAKELGVACHQDAEGNPVLGSEFDIPEDSYGAAILAIVKALSEGTVMNKIRFGYSTLILLLNFTLQFSCLYFIEVFVVAPSVHHVQSAYQQFHSQVFDTDGVLQQSQWDDYEFKEELCQIAMTNKIFYYTVLLLWTVSCLTEFRTVERLVYNISSVPHTDIDEEVFHDDGQETTIVAITPKVRYVLYGVVCVPKILISFMLLRLGLKWLTATTSFADMVMNAIAMTFVVQIDELLFAFSFPQQYQKQVEDTDFFIQEGAVDLEQVEWSDYRKSSMYLVAAFVIVIVYAEVVQDILPNTLSEASKVCHPYLREEFKPLCERSWGRMFQVFTEGFSAWSTISCYPYGGEE